MNNDQEYYLTPEGIAGLREELEELKGPRRAELAKRLREAIQQGDLSENADYSATKEDQAFVEGRIQEIETLLRQAVVIDGQSPDGAVALGSHVTIQEDGGQPEKYQLVGHTEADPSKGRISNESPIGQALMGAHKGDQVQTQTPGGTITFTILEVE
jgi:transcription elongation factor GreA